MKTAYLKTRMFLVCFAVIISGISCSKDETSIPEEANNEDAVNIEAQILQLVNTHRESIGKSALASNSFAASLAKDHTLFMIDQGKLSHDNSDERFERLFDEEKANKVGENVAYKYNTAEKVMEAWLNSSGHKKNIEGDFTHVGISALKNDAGQYYYTQLFLRK
ncbi:CAP domain-containing protein [uncultured Algibacter sp.]|uniref:CAP domain-containing protein n=1 Tax=uncultured Algibacter sp. TaxID=298659 RepID=UPI002624FA34|nr:CAP domain-containing protein [uncultured Algibacter sp.]